MLVFLLLYGCKPEKKNKLPQIGQQETIITKYAKGFSIEKSMSGITILKITSPWHKIRR